MTPDLTTRAVDVATDAVMADDGSGHPRSEFHRHEIEELMRIAVRALLAARTNCDECGGTGVIEKYPSLCPSCGGSGRGDGLLVAILMERVEAYERITEKAKVPTSSYQQNVLYCRPLKGVYVERPVDQEPTDG